MNSPYDYLKNPNYKINTEFEYDTLNDKKIKANVENLIKYNRDYLVIIPKGTVTESGITEEEITVKFTTQYKPIYCSILEVQDVLRELKEFFTYEEILKEIRNAGQKAHHLLKIQADANQEDYEEIGESEDNYYEVGQFCVYESARHLINRLVSDLIKNEGALPGGSSSSSISLGDFSMSSGGSSSSSKDQSLFEIVKANLQLIKEEVEFWKNSLLGRKNRGFSSPRSAVTRRNVPAPTQRGV